MDRRSLLKTLGLAPATGLAAGLAGCASVSATTSARDDASSGKPSRAALDAAMARPVLRTDRLPDPVIIESVELLRREENYIVRVRDTDGGVGYALTNPRRINHVYPILLHLIAPGFAGRDARELETIIDDVYRVSPTYKYQGVSMWICMGWVEFAVLDLLGRRAGVPVAELIGDVVRPQIGLYHANGNRSNSAEWVVDRVKQQIAESGAKAIKFKVGARMRYTDESTARDLKLIPMMREALGDDMTIYADSNGSYDVPMSLRMGQLMEDHKYGFFEEPVQFDYLEETRDVADALAIPIAGGEQESSLWRFRWLIENRALEIVQPDLLYFGGMCRSIQVARMAEAAGMDCVPHISGRGHGQIYVTHFAAALPNTTDHQEYKGDADNVPYVMAETGERFTATTGTLPLHRSPGFGVVFDPDWLASLSVVKPS